MNKTDEVRIYWNTDEKEGLNRDKNKYQKKIKL